ncbi:hypothetical protein AVEN_210065-1 [Araneus ventricosus]|uniref:Uncharacterized protein n=1 Tax=Araneus ventricosus TaxID=182803 RepID=A0A4Y2WD53_ARAVE|nr:hypothetical protein AVEN_210065-1 [Araneus ventricosus]
MHRVPLHGGFSMALSFESGAIRRVGDSWLPRPFLVSITSLSDLRRPRWYRNLHFFWCFFVFSLFCCVATNFAFRYLQVAKCLPNGKVYIWDVILYVINAAPGDC